MEHVARVFEARREKLADARGQIKKLEKRNRILEKNREEKKTEIRRLDQRVRELEEQMELRSSQCVSE